jgi:hypothetical protein
VKKSPARPRTFPLDTRGLPVGIARLRPRELADLPEYSAWLPSAPPPGARWKRKRVYGDAEAGWLLGELVEIDGYPAVLWRVVELDATPAELLELRWRPIASYPRRGPVLVVRVRLAGGEVRERAHWASNRSGEEMPPFEGWFVPDGAGFTGIPDPVAWMPYRPGEAEVPDLQNL